MSDTRRVSVGELRPTQILYTFGIGAIVDLPHLSVMVMGLDDWNREYTRPVNEDRLLAQVKKRLGEAGIQALRSMPMRAEQDLMRAFSDHDLVGVPVAPFPRWMRCPACNLLAPLSSELFKFRDVPGRPDLTSYVHESCSKRKKAPPVLPARFLLACENGHLDDFPWRWFVHRGDETCAGMLELIEIGISGEASDVMVKCRACETRRSMADAFSHEGRAHLPRCRGRRPHLRDFDERPCDAEARTILMGASNSWFAVTMSAFHVPTAADDALARRVDQHWNQLFADTEVISDLSYLRRKGQLGAFSDIDDDTLWAAVEKRRAGVAHEAEDQAEDLKTPEWQVFADPDPMRNGAEFCASARRPPERWRALLDKVVLLERVREVTALIGFTRVASPRDYAEDAELPSKVRAPIARGKPTWIPATEVRGEGIFIQFREQRIAAWCAENANLEEKFRRAHVAWRRRRGIEPPEAGFPGIRYLLLHSFAHALMREMAIECGYSSASLRERIYARDAREGGVAMAGVLIYTAAPDSEGTLGGLVRMGEPDELERHLRNALAHIELCSSDPLCAHHEPDAGGESLHGAVCHACLFAPETSCERGNKYLDRNVLVATLLGGDAAFFGPGRA